MLAVNATRTCPPRQVGSVDKMTNGGAVGNSTFVRMQHNKPLLLALLTVLSTVVGVVSAAAQGYRCERGNEVQEFRVLTPGVVGKACDLQRHYVSAQILKTPYRANNDSQYCATQAQRLVDELVGEGFACRTLNAGEFAALPEPVVASPVAAAATVPSPVVTPTPAETVASNIDDDGAPDTAVVEEVVAENTVVEDSSIEDLGTVADASASINRAQQEAANKIEADVEAESQPQLELETSAPTQTTRLASAPSPVPADAVPQTPASLDIEPARPLREDTPIQPLASPADSPVSSYADKVGTHSTADDQEVDTEVAEGPRPVSGLPVSLSPSVTEPVGARRPKQTAAGRITGVLPDPVHAAKPVAAYKPTTALKGVEDPSSAGGVQGHARAVSTVGLRPSKEIIKNVLRAQAAAWNEGDLEAYMTTYWQDPKLRVVFDEQINEGVRAVSRHFRDRYGERMGYLGFDEIEVEVVDEGVAVAVGHYHRKVGTRLERGVSTYMMKNFEGHWRIIHDTTVLKDANQQAAAMVP